MSNPLGSSGAGGPEDRNEFIELYNNSSDTVNLTGYFIKDFDTEDSLLLFTELSETENLKLAPGEFALILDPEYVDSGENYMPYGIPECMILRPENTTIGNGLTTTDSLILLNASKEIISTFYHPFNPGNGFSIERVSPAVSDIQENWGICTDTSGSTPGRINSIYSQPDLRLDSIRTVNEFIIFNIFNPVDTVLSCTLQIYKDENRNRYLDSGELIEKIFTGEISPFNCIEERIHFNEQGVHSIGFKFKFKTCFRRIRMGKGISNLILNELMVAPKNSTEWIELYNRSQFKFNLDSISIEEELPVSTIINPGEFLILTPDTLDFKNYYSISEARIMETSFSLNNSGDSIILKDKNGFILDKYSYNGDNVETGFSLEKVNPDISSLTRSNWSQSIPAAGTPGSINSVYADYQQELSGLRVSPRHFSPDNDGIKERCIISFDLPFNRNQVIVQIYDRKGRLIRENRDIFGGNEGQWIWDGSDSRGRTVPTNLYLIYLLIKDTASEKFTENKIPVSVGN